MSMLDRYKKKGEAGLMELVRLVEDAPEPKRSQLLGMIRNEDADYLEQVSARVLTFEGIRSLPENQLAEIIALTPVKHLAIAVFDESPEFVKLVEKCVGKRFSDYKLEKENCALTPPTPNQCEAAKRKVLAEARKLEATGQIKLTGGGISTENISSPSAAVAPVPAASAPGAPLAPSAESKTSDQGSKGARGEDPCPSIESFGIEVPVAGLSGERFEAFVKSRLGMK